MTTERLLQYCIALLAATGTLLLGLGQRNMVLPIVSIMAALSSLFLTDLWGWLRLNRSIANVAAILAVMIALWDFFTLQRDSQLLALANLLVYLQIVLLFQKKEERIYWQLLMLSLLQVMVAAALNFGILFGAILVFYLFVALIGLSLFLILRESNRFKLQQASPTTLTPVAASSSQTGQEELSLSAIGPTIWGHAVLQWMFTLALTLLIFVVVPRSGKERITSQLAQGQPMVGFSDSVRLGSLGTALQDPQAVMQIWFYDSYRAKSLALDEPPLLRGSVLNVYQNDRRGRSEWTYRGDAEFQTFTSPEGQPLPHLPEFRQEISLESLGNQKVVFGVYPYYAQRGSPLVQYNENRSHLERQQNRLHGRIRFNLQTTGLAYSAAGLRQRKINRATRPIDPRLLKLLVQTPSASSPDEPDPLERLKSEAERIVQDSELSASDRRGRAMALEQYFLTDPRFGYSLKGQSRNNDLDPIEDFIANNPTGHCEYYASALALMLRSQGIPARVVIGFKADEFNSLGNYYRVRQLHAHAWVEAYLEEDHLEGQFVEDDLSSEYRHGAWLRLDPTPGSSQVSLVAKDRTLVDRAKEWVDYSQYLWSSYVVGLNAQRQREVIYEPLAFAAEVVDSAFDVKTWTETIPAFVASLKQPETWKKFLDWILSLRGAFAILVLGGLSYLAFRLMKRLRRRIRRRRRGKQQRRRARQPVMIVKFYERFEALLRKQGLARPASQTQHEFALSIGGEFASRRAQARVAPISRQIVDTYYGVRFGERSLDKQETEAVEQALDELSAALQSSDAKSSP